VRILLASAWLAIACSGQAPDLSLDGPVVVGMPVWLKVPARNTVENHYPFHPGTPSSFGCKQVEVRRDGQLLPLIPGLATYPFNNPFDVGNPCSSKLAMREVNHPPRLPLHLRFRFDRPGIYEVRYSPTGSMSGLDGRTVWTEWMRFEIKAQSPGQRANWLKEMSARPHMDSTELLTDFLPSILGIPDPASLQILGQYLYHPDIEVRQYAAAGLTYWPDAEADARVAEWIRTRGPTDVMLYFIDRPHDGPARNLDSIFESTLPYLLSDTPFLVSGAIEAIRHLTYGTGLEVTPEFRARAFKATIEAAPHILALGDPVIRKRYREVRSRIGDPVKE
jgi:hypothetical protein